MLAIGRALMGNPILLLEPSVGIAHRLKIEIFQAIQIVQHAGVAAHGSCAREGKLTLGRIDALNFSRRGVIGVDDSALAKSDRFVPRRSGRHDPAMASSKVSGLLARKSRGRPGRPRAWGKHANSLDFRTLIRAARSW